MLSRAAIEAGTPWVVAITIAIVIVPGFALFFCFLRRRYSVAMLGQQD